ncbi:hypothetical protein LCGC14_2753400 [marine sediment metagenome]|uniref:Acetaldehyde dehydrogenase C-terminal domain-containing protein n=1 Tax=marine sediment metagenome TaxID=412755 RepID=A0A0F8Z1A9_9ZZZZ
MVDVAIIGTGKVGLSLLDKVILFPHLDCVMFAGIREDSPGIARAKKIGIKTSTKSIDAVVKSKAQIVFDCTTAKAHIKHAPLLKDRFTIDLTPSRVGKMCVPSINLKESLKEKNVNLVTCGIQAMGLIAKQTMDKHPEIKYMELVSTIASKSAGMGTRNNIDEFTQTTQDALEELCGVPKAKAIIVINPADINMRNTLTYEVNGKRESVTKIVKDKNGLAGNLNIINLAAIEIAEFYANR